MLPTRPSMLTNGWIPAYMSVTKPTPPAQYQPDGDRILIAIALIVVTALCGMIWSLPSRQSAPREAPAVKARHLPPSAQPDAAKPAPQVVAPASTISACL